MFSGKYCPSQNWSLLLLALLLLIRSVPVVSYKPCAAYQINNIVGMSRISFGSNNATYLLHSLFSFGIATAYKQKYSLIFSPGEFFITNKIPRINTWHSVAADYTFGDSYGYMVVFNLGPKNSRIMGYLVQDLCIGHRYEFTVYIVNVIDRRYNITAPNILFQVRAQNDNRTILSEVKTGSIPAYDRAIWNQYGVSFVPIVSGVEFLIISHRDGNFGRTIAIDDITLNSCSNESLTYCRSVCRTPTVRFWPKAPQYSSAASFRKTQDFYMYYKIHHNCSNAPSTEITWIIKTYSTNQSQIVSPLKPISVSDGQIFVRANSFNYGIYEFILNITVHGSNIETLVASNFFKIRPSSIAVFLIKYGTSVITSGHMQDLTLSPGKHSVDLDGNYFNVSEWKFTYWCSNYDSNDTTSVSMPQKIDDPGQTCFPSKLNGIHTIQYSSDKSAVTIISGSLKPNTTYRFLVTVGYTNPNSSKDTGYITVHVVETKPRLVLISCIITAMCPPNLVFQFANPTTQLTLFSECATSCSSIHGITWNIFEGGPMNAKPDMVRWKQLEFLNDSYKEYLFGMNTSNFTATAGFFSKYPKTIYWQFEVVYDFMFIRAVSAINFIINKPPRDGRCSVSPSFGTTSTLFRIVCLGWIDEDGIKDYTYYVWKSGESQPVMFASDKSSEVVLYLPAADDVASTNKIIVDIRDMNNGVTTYEIGNIIVKSNITEISEFVDILENNVMNDSISDLITNFFASKRYYSAEQFLTTMVDAFNNMYDDNVNSAIQKGVPVGSIYISPLNNIRKQPVSAPVNKSAFDEYEQNIERHAKIREYLVALAAELPISYPESIKLQASALAKLTAATSQLSREAILQASRKCDQLSDALRLYALKISCEDALLTASYIAQCTNNAFNAANGPLHGRANILKLDIQRSIQILNEYDTDLDYYYLYIYPFMVNNSSQETIEQNRNRCEQEKIANETVVMAAKIIEKLTEAISHHVTLDQAITIQTSHIYISMRKLTIGALSNVFIELPGKSKIRIHAKFGNDENETIFVRSIMQPLASAGNSKVQSHTDFSTFISASILNLTLHEIPINNNKNHLIELIIPRDPNMDTSKMILQDVLAINQSNESFHLQTINLVRTNNLSLSLHFEIRPLMSQRAYWFIYKFGSLVQTSDITKSIDGWHLFCPNNSINNTYAYYINNAVLSNHRRVVFGLRELSSQEMKRYCSSISLDTTFPISFNDAFNFSSNYELRTYTSGCYYLDSTNTWHSDGLIVGPLTDDSKTHCFSTHLTSFAGGFVPLPAPIDWNFVFSNAKFGQNKTIYLTVIILCILYLILVLFARFYDKKGEDRLGLMILPDNQETDKYFYRLIVFTGHRKNAGTESNVYFILGGDNDETSIRTLKCSKRKILQRGGIDGFVMSVPKWLGELNYIRVWHDNTGRESAASWFLKYIIIHDLQTMKEFYFISQQWFAVEQDDGSIQRLLPVASEVEKHEFAYVLSKQAYHSFSEGHLWFSIFARPLSSSFTRVQRCTCCFVLFFIAMLLSILYYNQYQQVNLTTNPNGFSLGPFYFSREEVIIGIITECISLVPSLLLVQFFRRIESRNINRCKVSPLRKTITSTKINGHSQAPVTKRKRCQFKFPWWCIFLAYGLAFLAIAVSILFIIVRSIELGDLNTRKWLASIVIEFFSSICLTQPLKVLCLAIFFACCLQRFTNDDELIRHIDGCDLTIGEESMHNEQDKPWISNQFYIENDRLSDVELKEARQQRLKEIQMWSIIKQLLLCLCFLWITYTIGYSHRDPNCYHQVNHLRRYLMNVGHSEYDYTKIKTIEEFWLWLNHSFTSVGRAQSWYNGYPPRNMHGFLDDKSNRLIGWIALRQLRIKKTSCKTHTSMKHLNITCNSGYSFSNEEQRSFEPGWTMNQTSLNFNQPIRHAFMYRTKDELDTRPYFGQHHIYGSGGYVFELRGNLSFVRSNLSTLYKLRWIDQQTRAVFIQCSLYNANANLFTSVTLLIEFLSTGSIVPTARIEPFNIQIVYPLSFIALAIIYMIFIIYFMIEESLRLFRLKFAYFSEFRSYIDSGIIVCSWIGFTLFWWRIYEVNHVARRFQETKGFAYVNLRSLANADVDLTNMIGLCCFFSTVRILRFFRFTPHLSLFGDTCQHAAKDLILFMFMYSIILAASASLFYLLFISQFWHCSSILRTAEMLIKLLAVHYDRNEIKQYDSTLFRFCFSSYTIVSVFITMRMIISIITDSFRIVRANLRTSTNIDRDMLPFIWKRFQNWIGMSTSSHHSTPYGRYNQMQTKYRNATDILPYKVEQLMKSLEQTSIDEYKIIARQARS